MNCKQCKAEMVEYQRSLSTDGILVLRYRCEVCWWEMVDIKSVDKPKDKKGFLNKEDE